MTRYFFFFLVTCCHTITSWVTTTYQDLARCILVNDLSTTKGRTLSTLGYLHMMAASIELLHHTLANTLLEVRSTASILARHSDTKARCIQRRLWIHTKVDHIGQYLYLSL